MPPAVPATPRLARVRAPVRAMADRLAPQREVLRGLHVVPDVEGPKIRLGIAWAVVTFVAVVGGAVTAAIWFTAAAVVAAANVCRNWRQQERRPVAPIALFGATAFPIAAAAGGLAAVGLVLAAVVLSALAWEPAARLFQGAARGRTDARLTIGVAAGIGLAAAAPVLVRGVGLTEAAVFVTFLAVYDASNYLVGSGAASPWEGPAAGAAFILAVTLAVAAVFVPPFRGLTPWLFGFLTALLAPLGAYAASALLPEPKSKAPGLRRLDSWIVIGPVWALFAMLLLG